MIKKAWKSFETAKILKELSLRRSGKSQIQKKLSRENNSINIWEELYLLSEILQNGKRLFSIFQEFSFSISKTFIFARRPSKMLSFYKLWTVPWFFQISCHAKSLGNSWGKPYKPWLLVIITHSFTCGKKNNC